jgi:hypothetical protein
MDVQHKQRVSYYSTACQWANIIYLSKIPDRFIHFCVFIGGQSPACGNFFATFDSLTRARRYLLWPGLCSRPFLFKKAKIIRKRCQHALKGAHNANSHDNNNKAVDSCAASSLLLECLDDNPLYRYLPIGECLSTRTYRTLSFKMNSIQLGGFDHNLIDN